MDGRLWLADSSEAGSAFVISLPLAAGAEHTEPERNMLGQTVLIASPSQFEAPYIGERLAAWGAVVECARGESEALAQLEGQGAPPDTLLIDPAFDERQRQKLPKRRGGLEPNATSSFSRRQSGGRYVPRRSIVSMAGWGSPCAPQAFWQGCGRRAAKPVPHTISCAMRRRSSKASTFL